MKSSINLQFHVILHVKIIFLFVAIKISIYLDISFAGDWNAISALPWNSKKLIIRMFAFCDIINRINFDFQLKIQQNTFKNPALKFHNISNNKNKK